MRIPIELYYKTSRILRNTLCMGVVIATLVGCHGKNVNDALDTNGNGHLTPNCEENCIRLSEAASDNSLHEDQFGKSPDWLELHNYGDSAHILDGWSLSDDPDETDKWVFPTNSIVAANGYLLVWASNNAVAKNEKVLNNEYHANFKISNGSETLFLYNPQGEKVDELLVEGLRNGTSIGRDSRGETVVYAQTTPGKVNVGQGYAGIVVSEVIFSHDGGVNAPATVSLSGAGEAEIIRYTLDARLPNISDLAYAEPIVIPRNTVIRAAIYKENHIPSIVASRTYLPYESHELPVVTLISESSNFFDIDTGIYELGTGYDPEEPYYGANFWQDWERDIHFAFYEKDGDLGAMVDAGVKIYGGYTRSFAQKSLAIHARGRYGFDEIEYPFFANREYDKFQAIVLRNSGNDWLQSMLRDVALTSLMEGTGVDYLAHRSASVYLNGEYWGMYNIREKINEHFLASLHGVDPDELDIVENGGQIIQGDNTDFLMLYPFLLENSLESAENFAVLDEKMDMENFISYNVAQIYYNNRDWPGNNQKIWKSPETKWRWILYDTDFGFGIWNEDDVMFNTLAFALEPNGPDWPNPPAATLLLRRLVENEGFRTRFINRFADYFNSRFEAGYVQDRIDALASVIASEMPQHFERWRDSAWADWDTEINKMKAFAEYRVGYLSAFVVSEFGLDGIYTLIVNINDTEAGTVLLNSLVLSDSEWQGEYFSGVPVTISAQAKEGYVFSHWLGASDATSATITLVPADAATVEAVFVKDE